MNAEKFKLDKIFWRKSLIFIFLGLILYACTMIAIDCIDYHQTSVRLGNLKSESMEQMPPEKMTMLQTILKSRQRRYSDNISSETIGILIGLIGMFFVERKTRK
jgi:hypothetical protein